MPSRDITRSASATTRDALAVAQRLYAGALAPAQDFWATALAGLADFLGARSAGASSVDKATRRITLLAVQGFDGAAAASSFRRFGVEADPMFVVAQGRPAFTAFLVADDPSPRDGRRSPFFELLAAPQGVAHSLAGVVRNDAQSLDVVSFWRDEDAAFTAADRERLEWFLPHIAQAAAVNARAGARADAGARPAGATPPAGREAGLVALDEDGQVLLVNAAAARMMGGAAPLQVLANRLVPRDPGLRDELERARVESLAAAGPGPPVIVRPARGEGAPAWEIQFRRADAGAIAAPLPPGAATLVVLADPAAVCQVPPARLRALGLTSAEARLCEGLLRLGTLPRAAADMGVAPGTARSHLKGIYAKLGVTSQVELVQALLSGAAAD